MLLVLMFYPLYFIAKSFFILLHFYQVGTREQNKRIQKAFNLVVCFWKNFHVLIFVFRQSTLQATQSVVSACGFECTFLPAKGTLKDRIESLTTKINKVSRTAWAISKKFSFPESQESEKKKLFISSRIVFFYWGHLSKLTRKKKYKPCVSVLYAKAQTLPWENEFSSLFFTWSSLSNEFSPEKKWYFYTSWYEAILELDTQIMTCWKGPQGNFSTFFIVVVGWKQIFSIVK